MLPLASFKVKQLLLWDIVLKTVYLPTPFFLGVGAAKPFCSSACSVGLLCNIEVVFVSGFLTAYLATIQVECSW